jgi:hypothetical protein
MSLMRKTSAPSYSILTGSLTPWVERLRLHCGWQPRPAAKYHLGPRHVLEPVFALGQAPAHPTGGHDKYQAAAANRSPSLSFAGVKSLGAAAAELAVSPQAECQEARLGEPDVVTA